ncbi:NADAR family protein [Rapidithrix thailandica]|uniref:NADAR family protein n=1 Tax=Rapidithrix thailandica TaxID=413964 RepID=A0AAW9SDR3_9BACT
MSFFYGYHHPLSQWYYSDFEIGKITFNCCEQWMMYSKAILFKDEEKARQILEESRANIQRKLGRQIRYFKNDIWVNQREEIIYQGNLAKFSQNAELKKYLLDTGDNFLAEASPTDLIWGIGLAEEDDKRFDQKNWTGKNLLGKLLMEVRATLANRL